MNPFNIALAEEKEEKVRDNLTQRYPRLPVEIINTAIETCTWHTLFEGTSRYNTQIALDTFDEMASNLVEERQTNSIAVVEMLLLEHDKSAGKSVEENGSSELVKGIRSIPAGILLMTLKSVREMWNSTS
jgi:hypothetical protein